MVLLYMVLHGSHQYTQVMLAYIPAPWILWAMIKNPFYQSLNITHCLLSRLLLTIINRHKNPPDPPRRGNHAGTTSRNHAGTTSRESSPDHHKVASLRPWIDTCRNWQDIKPSVQTKQQGITRVNWIPARVISVGLDLKYSYDEASPF